MIFQKYNPRLGKYTTLNTTIAEKEILKIGVEEFDVLKTVLLSVGILAVVVVIFGLTWGGPGISFGNGSI